MGKIQLSSPDHTRNLKDRIDVTLDLLKKWEACETQLSLFKEVFPAGVFVHKESHISNYWDILNAMLARIDVDWLLRRIHWTGFVPKWWGGSYYRDGCNVSNVSACKGSILIDLPDKYILIQFDSDMNSTIQIANMDGYFGDITQFEYVEDEYEPKIKENHDETL